MASLALLLLGACAAVPPDATSISRADFAALTREISALGAEVDPEEAARAAEIALTYAQELARDYQVTDPPLIHNTKVNLGLKERGLCWHWADDMEARLREEGFRTLRLHRAIANADNAFRIDHSTVIVSQRGDSLYDGLVLDPWRKGGDLHWAPTGADGSYAWVPRQDVFAERRRRSVPEGAQAGG